LLSAVDIAFPLTHHLFDRHIKSFVLYFCKIKDERIRFGFKIN
jgi:hypothetical protein